MLQPIQTAGAMTSLSGKRRGIRKRGSNFYWDDAWFRQQAHMQARQIVTATAAKAARIAKRNMKDKGGAHGMRGQYPAVQSGNLKDAIDSNFLADTGTWIIAIFGVYGRRGQVSQAEFDPEHYDDETPVWEYARTLETGAGRDGQWPWVNLTLEEVAKDGWVDAETVETDIRSLRA